MASAAQGLRPLVDGLLLLPHLAPGWDVAEDSRRPPPESPGPSWSQAQPFRGDHRQPIGENRGKRGARGYDAGKKIKGRKRHIVVDTLGLLLAVVVHPANIQDRDGAKLVLPKLVGKFSRLQLIWADGGYAGQLIAWTQELGHWILEIVKRSDDVTGFQILPKRWIVERTFAWFGRYRRLSKDYETLTESSEAMIYMAMIHLMLRRLKPCVV
jgi:transposase